MEAHRTLRTSDGRAALFHLKKKQCSSKKNHVSEYVQMYVGGFALWKYVEAVMPLLMHVEQTVSVRVDLPPTLFLPP